MPYNFRRVRKRGFFAPQSKKALARVRQLLGMEERPEPEKVERPEARVESSESNPFTGDAGRVKVYALPCPKCGKEMSWRGEIEPQVDWVRGRHRYLMDALLVALREAGLTTGLTAPARQARAP